MSEAARYRQQAREFEQRENWKRAIEAYELAIEADRSAMHDVDLASYNRVGDLYRRIGNVHKAVEYYERAADGHLAAGFYNNAIALCNKILRNQPNRHSAYLKLGKIGAAKGFLSDARKHFLEYAERMQKSGELDAAFAALIEFASLSPDPEVRLMIADQLIGHNLTDMAVDQLRLVWRDMKQEGRDTDAERIRERILEMDPNRDPEEHPPEENAVAGIDAEGVIDLPEILPYDEPETPRPAPAAVEPEPEVEVSSAAEDFSDAESTDLDDSALEVGDTEVVGSGLAEEEAGIEAAHVETESEPIDLVPTSLGHGDEHDAEAPPVVDDVGIVPTMLAEEDDRDIEEPVGVVDAEEGLLETSVSDAETEAVDEEYELDTSVEGWGEPVAEVVSPSVQEADLAEEEQVAPEDRVAELESKLQFEGEDPELLVELADALLEVGDREQATRHLEAALAMHEERGQFRRAGRVLDELLRLDVNDMRAYQKRVELALRTGDRAGLIDAYLGLADCLDRTDAGNKARVVYGRVLELDPANARAATALEMIGEEIETERPPEPAPSAPAAAATSDEYVDLGSLVREGEGEEKSTRFMIPTADPESEDDVNFEAMLNQFKSKVAEAIEKEDASSHYDLGLAFKDMGLIDEAITEFQIAARSRDYRLRAIEMLGDCFLEKGDHRVALKVLTRALQVSGHTDEELIGIHYAIGRAYEAVGEPTAALDWYERVMGCDMSFRDVFERASALGS